MPARTPDIPRFQRADVVKDLKEHGGNGGIVVPPGHIARTRTEFRTAAVAFNDAHLAYTEALYPRVYTVAVFGSARLTEGTPEFQHVEELTKMLGDTIGCDIITGGGPAIMAAAPKGLVRSRTAPDAPEHVQRARTHGATIKLPWEEKPNEHLDGHFEHTTFNTRLAEFMTTHAMYVAPGGIGSLYELVMPLQLKQVRQIETDFPLIVHPMYRPILEAVDKAFYHDRVAAGQIPTINEGDVFNNVVVTDDIPTIVEIIAANHAQWKANVRDKVRTDANGNGQHLVFTDQGEDPEEQGRLF